MPGVQVNLYAAARAAVGAPSVSAAPGTLAEILAGICADHPKFRAVWPQCSFLVDGLAVHGDVQAVMIHDGSALDVLPPFAGG